MRITPMVPWIALAGVIAYVSWFDRWPSHHPVADTPSPELPAQFAPSDVVAQAGSGPISYAPAVAKAAPAVVNIFTTQRVQVQRNPMLEHPFFRFYGEQMPNERSASSLGSGVIVAADGYILTNNHVVQSAESIVIALHDGREVDAKVIGTDPDTDLALLKVDLQGLPALPFNTTNMAVGDVALAIGNPFGVGQTVTQGIISAQGRSGLGINTYEDFIQTDAAINPGNSGGALIDVNGNLIGINTAIFSRSGGNMGIGFAIPAELAKTVMDSLIRHGRVLRGWLGVEIASGGRAANGRESSEVFIAGVMPGGPADKAGLKRGDQIIEVAGQSVVSANQVIRQIGALAPKARTEVIVRREGRVRKIDVTMGERPAPRT
ncbi:MAG: trypsin-like peptidase domain-containing protein [Moraxellaceae bacterium]|nr:trypsin-like peptidase domain-containing protein [Moraxellaceae bacterium]MDZ4388043.1 trypsin-like peptidase domain-containing protein [Moraxellaceae bacterium]